MGGARFADGVQRCDVSWQVVVNTGDDFRLHGLTLCPDLDTVLYTLAGWADAAQGWGLAGDTRICASQLQKLGGETWFQLGDLDLATHLYRSHRLGQGASLQQVTSELCQRAGLPAHSLLPMSDEPAPTRVRLSEGWVDFQDYFVRRQHRDPVEELSYTARPLLPAARQALEGADRILLAPSNPLLSLFPIFHQQGMKDLWATLKAPKIAISPMIGNQAVKGPLASLLASLGHPVSSLGVAHLLLGWIDTLIVDESDRPLQSQIEALGLRVQCTNGWMRDNHDRRRLAEFALHV